MMVGVGALVTLELPEDSPIRAMPWIVTFGPLSDDDDWEPVVCGPYERPHALALAEEVVADEDLMAVVEPLLPFVSTEEIRSEIIAAKVAVTGDDIGDINDDLDYDDIEDEGLADRGNGDSGVGGEHEIAPLPDPDEVRAGMVRIARRLAADTG